MKKFYRVIKPGKKKCFIACKIASYKEPFWWVIDKSGYKIVPMFSVQMISKATPNGINKGLVLIIGPFNLMLGWIE